MRDDRRLEPVEVGGRCDVEHQDGLPGRGVERAAILVGALDDEVGQRRRDSGGERAAEFLRPHDVEQDGGATDALSEHAAIEIEAAAVGIASENVAEGAVDELGIAQQQRLEPRLQVFQKTAHGFPEPA